MSHRPNTRLGREGFTLVELLVTLGIVAVLVTMLAVAISGRNPQHKALKARAQAQCDSTAKVSPDSFSIAVAEIPKGVESQLSADLSPVRTRYFHWRRRTTADGVVCEVQYCFTGRLSSGRLGKNCTTWEAI